MQRQFNRPHYTKGLKTEMRKLMGKPVIKTSKSSVWKLKSTERSVLVEKKELISQNEISTREMVDFKVMDLNQHSLNETERMTRVKSLLTTALLTISSN